MSNLIITINFKKYSINSVLHTLLQRCELLSIMIPRFCFHEKLSIAGNCRMCLVEVNNSPKPVVACSTKVLNGLVVLTNSILIRQVREHIIEFLLINHPLDCPICDQGGECDLQDQTLIYGSDRGRFKEIKRSVLDKNFGPFIKTVMTRCIHCTKCVRFLEEYGEYSTLGTLGRGRDTEIGLYSSNNIIYSELSGNIIDLCPVGALTSKPYAFKARSWELIGTESLDIFDSFGSNILIQTRSNEILRILPRRNDYINESWITNQIRFGYDAFKKQRLLVPYVYSYLTKKIIPINWKSAILFFISNFLNIKKKKNIFSDNISFFSSKLLDIESVYILNKFSIYNNVALHNVTGWSKVNNRSNYLLTKSICEIEYLNFTLILGLDFKTELPLLNLKIKKSTHIRSSLNLNIIYYIGTFVQNNINLKQIGFSTKTVLSTLYYKNNISIFIKQQNNFSFFYRSVRDSSILWKIYFPKHMSTTFYNSICLFSGNIHTMEVNAQLITYFLLNTVKKKISTFNYFVGIDTFINWDFFKNSLFTVFQGSNFSEAIIGYNLFFPSSNFTEGSIRFFMNLEGRIQRTFPAITNPGSTLSNTNIIKTLIISLKWYNLKYHDDVIFKNSVHWAIPYLNDINSNQNVLFIINNFCSNWLINMNYLPTTKHYYNTTTHSNNSTVLIKSKIYTNINNNFFNL